MSPTQQTHDKPADKDFSEYTWIPGVNELFNSVCVIERTQKDGAMVFVRGYSKKFGKNATVSGHFDYEALENLWNHIGAILGHDKVA